MSHLTQGELDKLDGIWDDVLAGKFDGVRIGPVRVPAESGRDFLSIPNSDGTARTVYERKEGEQWKVVQDQGGKSEFS